MTRALTLACLPPFIVVTYFAFSRFVNLPYLDQWEYIPLIEKSFNNNLSLSDLLAQHNQHKILFPRVIMLLLAYLTNLNLYFVVAINLILGAGIYLTMIKIISHLLPNDKFKILPTLISIFLFSINQWQNWIWDPQIPLSTFAAVLGFYFFTSTKLSSKTILVSLALGIIALYSFGAGIWYFPVSIVILFFKRETKNFLPLATIYLLVAIILEFSYLYGFRTIEDPAIILREPLTVFSYFVKYLGSPFAAGIGLLSFAFGLLGIGFSVYAYVRQIKRGNAQQIKYLLPLTLFALLNALTTALTRGNLGSDHALISRYITISNLFWIPIFVFSYTALSESKINFLWKINGSTLAMAIIYLFLVCTSASAYYGYLSSERMYRAQKEAESRILTTQEEEYPAKLLFLKRNKLSYFGQ